jgi:hypothetical protein
MPLLQNILWFHICTVGILRGCTTFRPAHVKSYKVFGVKIVIFILSFSALVSDGKDKVSTYLHNQLLK